MTYYRTIDGVRYARDLLDEFERLAAESPQVSLPSIQHVYERALDGPAITEVERRTLQRLARHPALAEPARLWLEWELGAPDLGRELERRLARIVADEYRAAGLTLQIDFDEARQQEGGGGRLLESALRGALDAFLSFNRGQLSFGAFAARAPAPGQSSMPSAALRAWLARSTLSLLARHEVDAALQHDLPDGLDIDGHWLFRLDTPEFGPARFLAHVRRDAPVQHSSGYLSRRTQLDALVNRVIRSFGGFERTSWQIDSAEAERQLASAPGQNFGNALFAIVRAAIFNGESSFSFRDFIRQEIWQDPDRALDDYIREYVEAGTLFLLPPPERRLPQGFVSAPELSPDFGYNWVFGLEMPAKTHVRFILTTPRHDPSGDVGYCDGFIRDDLAFDERLARVVREEFELDGLALAFSQDEWERQRRELGPEWRHAAGLVRQALNTALHDHQTPESVFRMVASAHGITKEAFEDAFAYRRAVAGVVHSYLKSGSLELLSRDTTAALPQGETVDVHWLFSLRLPALTEHGYFIVIPRWPDDEGRPYVYGSQ